MPWRGLIIVAALLGALALDMATDTGAQLLLFGPVEVTNGTAFGVEVGDTRGEAIEVLRHRFGDPTVIDHEPSRRLRIRSFESLVFHDPGPFAGVIAVDVRDGRVFRVRADYLGLVG